jgi:putative tricarboxylic transport membrane protein
MEFFHYITGGFSIALQPTNLTFCFFGVLMGTLVGVLPGLGPVAAMSLLLPATFHLSPIEAIIMLSGIFYGAQYGGSTTSILLNVPGESSSVITCLDGYQMARKGRAGPALGIAAFGSFIAGTIGIIGLTVIAPILSNIALVFGPQEYTSLMIFGLTILSFLSHGSIIKCLIMAAIGLFLGCIGTDLITSSTRFTYNSIALLDGVGLIPIIMGFFGISEVLNNLENTVKGEIYEKKITGIYPNRQDWRNSLGAIFRGTGIGFFLGILPGGGAMISSFAAYAIEKKISKHPEEFGTGVIQGVASPEAANNAAAQTSFIPLLTLGIPANVTMAIMLGALMIHKIPVGPLLIKQHPDLFWGVVTSMYIGNIMLLCLNLPLIGIWVKILKIPYNILFPLILVFCLVGVYTVNNSTTDIYVMGIFSIMGYFLKKFKYDAAPLILAFVLGPMLETNLRRSLLLSDGDFLAFFMRPISGFFLLASIIILMLPLFDKKPLTENMAGAD